MNVNKQKTSSHVPIRTCVGCRARAPQRDLVRIARRDGQLVIDPRRHKSGRGAYVHRMLACIERATGRGSLSRAFRKSVARSQTEALHSQLIAFLKTDSTPIQPKDQ